MCRTVLAPVKATCWRRGGVPAALTRAVRDAALIGPGRGMPFAVAGQGMGAGADYANMGSAGVTRTAAELALEAMRDGKSVLAVDTCPMRHLRRDIEEEGFHYLDDVRQLFRPDHEARWKLEAMPKYGMVNYPEEMPVFITISKDPNARMGYRPEAGKDADAAIHLQTSIA
jgi:hypothetical protein